MIIQNGSNKKMKNQLIHQLMPPLIGDDKEVKMGTWINMFTLNNLLTRPPIKRGNNSYKLTHEIRQVLFHYNNETDL